MQILCIDIGRGTQDILLYDSAKRMENCISLVLPSPVVLIRQKLEQTISSGRTPLLYGGNMGGFALRPYVEQLKEHGKKIVLTYEAAKTFNDYPEELLPLGVSLISDDRLPECMSQAEFFPIKTGDLDLEVMLAGFDTLGISPKLDGIALAVQDHGQAPPDMSDRRFRFQHYQRLLKADIPPIDWAYMRSDIPAYLTRMQALADSLPKDLPLLVMDTGMAAVVGSLEDQTVAAAQNKLLVNIGNGHTLAVYLQAGRITGLWEHHTQRLSAPQIDSLLDDLINGSLDNEDIFADGGHGAFINSPIHKSKNPELTCLTGPNRALMDGYDYYLASPHGNMMLTGAYGLLKAYLAKYKLLQP